MNVIKWLRKNNRKIMVFVVIFSMVSFVIGSYGIKILVSIFGGDNQLIAEYEGGKIKGENYLQAQNELNVLRLLSADRLLMSQNAGLSGPLMVNLLFRDSQLTGDLGSQMKQAAQQGQLPLSVEKIESYFNQKPERPEILWLLLKEEAYGAGFIIPVESARMTLQAVIPQLSGGQGDYAQVMSAIMRNTNMSEQQILRTFADLMSVLSYAGTVMSNQAVTIDQVRADVARNQERIDVDLVKIQAADLVDPNEQVADAQLQKQFETYKEVLPNSITEENPFGFGYKLPKRVQIEYMVVPMNDVRKQIEKPTQEAVETYYSRNIQQFQNEVPADPNKPDGEKITKTRPFSEVESSIRRQLEEQQMTTLANQIFIEARDITQKGFEAINFEQATGEQIQMAAGDYQAAAKQLSEKYKVGVVAGKTGLLSPEDFSKPILNSLAMQSRQNYIRLADLAFAVTKEKPERQPIGLPPIRIWENIGPLSGGFYSEASNQFDRLMALVRVTNIEDPQVPQSIDTSYDAGGIIIFDEQKKQDSQFSLKEKVKKDVLLLKAFDTAKARAEELSQMVKDQGWDKAIEAFNKKYAEKDADKAVKVDSLTQQQRFAQSDISTIRQYIQDNPAAAGGMQMRLNAGLLTNRLYQLLEPKAQSTGEISEVVPFAAEATAYVVKEITRKPANVEDYIENKAMTALQLNAKDSAELALIHFSTENILKRMDYMPKTEDVDSKTVQQQQQAPVPAEDMF